MYYTIAGGCIEDGIRGEMMNISLFSPALGEGSDVCNHRGKRGKGFDEIENFLTKVLAFHGEVMYYRKVS